MSALSDYLENAIIDHLLRNQAFTPPATVYLALFTANTGLEADSGVTGEVSGGAYARQTCALNAASSGATANTSEITFPTATLAWGTITHWALVDHVTQRHLGDECACPDVGGARCPEGHRGRGRGQGECGRSRGNDGADEVTAMAGPEVLFAPVGQEIVMRASR